MINECVIIGAGQTGRGFLAPFMEQNEIHITFIDKNLELVHQLNQERSYKVKYYNGEREDKIIDGFEAFASNDIHAIDKVAQADLVMTCIGSDNLKDLIPLLESAISKRNKENKLTILCCENGVNVKNIFIEKGLDAIISEAVIFCTTMDSKGNSLTLNSQYYPDLPFDSSVEGINLNIKGLTPINDFPSLIQRKIYTYNCLSACIAYLGAYKGYKIYGQAANDEEISNIIDKVLEPLNRTMSLQYNISLEEQSIFAEHAIKKFKNLSIMDTIERNCRDVDRKLGPTERLVMPLRIFLYYNEDIRCLELIIASAIYYGYTTKETPEDAVLSICKLGDIPTAVENIDHLINNFTQGLSIHEMLEL